MLAACRTLGANESVGRSALFDGYPRTIISPTTLFPFFNADRRLVTFDPLVAEVFGEYRDYPHRG